MKNGYFILRAPKAYWQHFEITHMSTSDGIRIELFSFPHGKKEATEFNPFDTGLFHFWVQEPDIKALIDKIVAYGAYTRILSK